MVGRRRSGGFTLLEMTIVVAILVVVAGAAVLALDSSEENAKADLARSEMATLRDACVRWKQDLGTYLPDPTIDFPSVPNGLRTGPAALPSFRTATASATYPLALTPLVALELGIPGVSGAGATLTAPALSGSSDTLPQNPGSIVVGSATAPQALGLYTIVPFSTSGGIASPLASWNPVTRRGWRGPYLSFPDVQVVGSVALPLRVIVLGENGNANGTYELADPWDVSNASALLSSDANVRAPATSTSVHSWYRYSLTPDPRDLTLNGGAYPTTIHFPPVGFTLTSSGPDRSLGTSDDLVVTYP